MSTGECLFMMFIAFLLIIIPFCIMNGDSKKLANAGVLYQSQLNYCGGDKKVISDCTVTLSFMKNHLRVYYGIGIENKINYKDIIAFEGLTQQQIRSDVTLTRLALFGVFALGMKKKKVDNQHFIVMRYYDCDRCEVQLILGEYINTNMQTILNNCNNNLMKMKETLSYC